MLSVGLPVYNGARWTAGALDSFLGQSLGDFEVIVADNASTDDTEAVCRAYAERDARVRYFRNPTNIGVYANFNRVLELARGRYFKWAACSDLCLEGFFQHCVETLERRPDAVLAYPRAYLVIVDADGQEVAHEYDDGLNIEDALPAARFRAYLERERINNVMHGVARRAALLETALHRPYPGSDISMVAELALRGKILEIPERLFVRRFTPETSSGLMSRSRAAQLSMPAGRSLAGRVNLHAYRFVSVARAPIPLVEKLKAWGYLLGWLVSLRHQVMGRLARGLR
ncbi:MAG: glycosyltransferase family 2 protein [Burkholderiales bacterium]|nr:glycosyltransferase family 2 protein [Burkholderiales bacterium]